MQFATILVKSHEITHILFVGINVKMNAQNKQVFLEILHFYDKN